MRLTRVTALTAGSTSSALHAAGSGSAGATSSALHAAGSGDSTALP